MSSRLSALRTLGPAVLAVGILGLGVLTAGTAYAFWTTTGAGTGTATSAAALPLSVTLTASGPLHPGATVAATAVFRNPNPFAVTVTGITPGALGVEGAAGCTAANSGVRFAPATGPWSVPARSGGVDGTAAGVSVPAAVSMSLTSDDACQKATFTAELTVAGTSS